MKTSCSDAVKKAGLHSVERLAGDLGLSSKTLRKNFKDHPELFRKRLLIGAKIKQLESIKDAETEYKRALDVINSI